MANIKKQEFEAIEKALNLIDFENLSEQEKKIVIDADTALVYILKRKKKSNEKTRKAIAEKRKTNPDYARSKSKNTFHKEGK